MSVRRAQHEIDAAEFAEWQAYYRLEPWGEWRADLRAGILSSTFANVHRGKHSPPFTAQDFMPQFEPPPRKKKQTAAEMQALLRLVTRAAGGTINGVKG